MTAQAPAAASGSGGGCQGGRITFQSAPVDLDATAVMVPLGLMSGSHVTPVDHIYFQNYRERTREIAVFSPAAGTVKDIQHLSQSLSDGPNQAIDDYRLTIEHTCTISSIFIHVATLSPSLAAVAPPPGQYARVNVALRAGEQIGTYRGNVDYNVVDTDVILPGLLVPEHYAGEPWKIHAAPPFEYFSQAIRQQMEALSLRAEAPFDGRFDYDIDGRLVGNWFQEGTGGYRGTDTQRYWAGHLAIAYDHLVPSHVVISIGTFDGKSVQLAVRGNTPDPADVSVASGLVVYELVGYDRWAGSQPWDGESLVTGLEARNRDSGVRGTVLLQLVEDRRLRVEAFPGKSASEVTGFTAAALMYQR
ncbi:MAG: hypothetical protein QF664_10250 [Dehalococcoidia bacterium]|jgi:hypothetical protein|nr:hypothetical protein [Dehalococcoidia bacterium]